MGWNTLAVIAEIVVIEGSDGGVFVYDSSGNLVDSMSFLPNVDPQTSSNLPGVTSYLGTIIAQLYQGQLNLGLRSDAAFAQLAAAAGQLSLSSGKKTAGGTTAELFMNSSDSSTGLYGLLLAGAAPAEAILLPSGDTTGATDLAAINSLLASGYAIRLAPGTFYINAPISMGSGSILQGAHGSQGTPEQGSTIMAAAGFTGASMVSFPNNSGEQEIGNLNLDASALAAGTVVGISASGLVVTGLDLHDLFIVGNGFNQGIIGGGKGWWLDRVTVNGTHGTGFSFGSVSDTTWQRCHAIGCGGTGYFIANDANGKMVGCKAEFCNIGFHITAVWTGGNGSGGFQLIGCSTDRNVDDGVLIDASSTGEPPINITGHMSRRDGSSGGSWAGITCNNVAIPVTITGLSTYVGVNDDGSGTNSPKYGFQIVNSSANVNLHSGVLLGATAGLNDDGSNTNWFQGPFVLSGHGTTTTITWDDRNFLSAQRITSTGLSGSTTASRYVGATAGGHPLVGTYNTGDFIIDTVTPAIFVCTAGGSPGTWAAV